MPIKKLPLVAAIAAVLAAPAAFAQSDVRVYGKLYPHLINEKGSGATAVGTPKSTLSGSLPGTNGVAKNNGMTSGNSRFGIRGSEDLGGGLKAVFQMESSLAVENGGSSIPQFWDRDTFVGFESKQYGTLLLGQMDTIFKNYGDTIGILGVSSGTFMSSSNILRKPGFGTSSAARFHERWGNSVQYESPEVSGFQIGVQVSDDARDDVGDQKGYSLGLKYDKGPWYFAIAHEIHDDFFGGSAQSPSGLRNTIATGSSKDKATQFTVEWRLNKQHKFEFDVIQKEYKESGAVGRFQSYKNTAYMVAMENRWNDQFRTAAHIVKSNAGSCSLIGGAVCSTDGLDGTQVVLGASYYLSKRTYGFTALSRVTNGKSARFSTAQLGGARTNYGEDLTQFAVGISHSF
jgi:predicted porin